MEDRENNAAVGIIRNPSGLYLLQKKDGGYQWNPKQWVFFGGQIEKGENSQQAFVREIWEEVGLTLEEVKFLKEYPYRELSKRNPQLQRHGLLYVFSARYSNPTSDIRLNEGAGFALFEREEIADLDMPPHNKDILLEFIANQE